jgi:hypothetical protein
MNRKIIFGLIFILVASNFLLVQAKSDPYVEDADQEWGGLSNPSSIWSPNALAVHAGRLGTEADVDAFTVSFPGDKSTFQFQIFVPVCGQHFANFRPSVALIGPGLDTPKDAALPFTLPKGMGAWVFPDDRSLNGARIAVPTNTITGQEPVYSTNLQSITIPQAGDYTVAVWEPDGNVGAYMLSTGTGSDSFADRPQSELDAEFTQLFSGEWIGQDCNAPLTVSDCAAESSENASASLKPAAGNFLLSGVVWDTATCQPVTDAEVRYWLLGNYDEDLAPQGKVATDDQGSYLIEAENARSYDNILVTITADGYQMAVADYSLNAGMGVDTFNLALQPENQ